MRTSTTTYFEDDNGHCLEIDTAADGAITVYSHGEIVTISPTAIPLLAAAIQHAGRLAAASDPHEEQQ